MVVVGAIRLPACQDEEALLFLLDTAELRWTPTATTVGTMLDTYSSHCWTLQQPLQILQVRPQLQMQAIAIRQ